MNDLINRIINADCLDVMKDMPDKCVDLIVTSPPYNLGNNHHTGNKKHNPYNDDMPEDIYQIWQITVLNECYRILKDVGSMMYNHKNRIKDGISITPYQWLLKTNFIVKQEIVWQNRSQNFDPIRFYPFTERVYWLAKQSKTVMHNILQRSDICKWNAEGIDKEHSRSFPLEMVEDLIVVFPDAKLIFDPFAGSGTTAVAAKELNRRFICVELDPKYVEIGNKRLRQEVLGI